MKIALISLYLPSGSKIGSGYQAHAMANAFVAKGCAVTMFSPCERPEDALYEHLVVPVGDRWRTFRFAWELGRRDWSGFDVVHAHGDDYWMWFRKPVHIRTMHGSCLAEAIHIPGFKEKLRMGLLGLSEIIATFAAHQTVCVSRNTRAYYPWVKQVIPNGVDLKKFHPGAAKAEHPTILFVGTYRNRKRGHLVMQAFAEKVRPALPQAELWMVCSDAPAAPGVKVLGRVDEETLTDLYRRAWVFCLPSSYEGFGVPYLEAMASGTAVVATPNPGAREVLGEGHCGRVVAEEELASALLELLLDQGARDRLVAAGLSASVRYSWPQIFHEYQAVYRQGQDASPGFFTTSPSSTERPAP